MQTLYLAMLAQPLIADNCVFPELQLLIHEQGGAGAAQVCQQAGQLFLQETTTMRGHNCANGSLRLSVC